jgi:spore maturation protein CgeB
LGLTARIHGVRYPDEIRAELARRGIDYAGWLPNHEAPSAFARALWTVHVPRRPYVEMLPGIPTIRVFEALACGIPLVSAPWHDAEGLFPEGCYLRARSGEEMTQALSSLRADPHLRDELVQNGLRIIAARHSCAHRVDEMLAIVGKLGGRAGATLITRTAGEPRPEMAS